MFGWEVIFRYIPSIDFHTKQVCLIFYVFYIIFSILYLCLFSLSPLFTHPFCFSTNIAPPPPTRVHGFAFAECNFKAMYLGEGRASLWCGTSLWPSLDYCMPGGEGCKLKRDFRQKDGKRIPHKKEEESTGNIRAWRKRKREMSTITVKAGYNNNKINKKGTGFYDRIHLAWLSYRELQRHGCSIIRKLSSMYSGI
jgi:hypothetical protein